VPPDNPGGPVGQWDDPLAVVLGKREDEDAADSLDLAADPDDPLAEVEVF
jgi:hypothetical protein